MKTASQLREQAKQLLKQARLVEASERRAHRKARDRAAYVIGGFLIRRRPEQVRSLLAQLTERDRSLVEAALSDGTPAAPSQP